MTTKQKIIQAPLVGETFSLREFDYGTLNNAINFLTSIQDRHPGKTLTLLIEQERWSDYEHYQVCEQRPETEEEYKARKAKEKEKRDTERKYERQLFEQLKKKFKD